MNKIKFVKFFTDFNQCIRDNADDYVANYHKSPAHLIRIELWTILTTIASIFCVLAIISYPWINLLGFHSYPWYAIPGAIVSPTIIWRSIHVITSVNWHLAQF
jgi:hypothetical protein